MGALHPGHARLLDVAASRPGPLVVSVFVNPLQFGPAEDLARYPRTLAADLAVCRDHGVDIVFAPSVDEVYPAGEPQVSVDPGPVGSILEGASRPGHYRGVLTVVAKLFGLVGPDVAVFGQKDYQQLVLIGQLVEDLCMPIEVVGAETVREPDGLALSSRNRFLDPDDRISAVSLSRALLAGRAAASGGAAAVMTAAERELANETRIDVDYLALRTPNLVELAQEGPARLLVAASVGGTRLIDNLALDLGRCADDQGRPPR
jgi:pantoate--beta-alanine ligase